MRKIQAELNFNDFNDFNNSNQWERRQSNIVNQITRQSMDFIHHAPMPRHHRVKVICLECGIKSSTSSAIPECPGCGGSDLELT